MIRDYYLREEAEGQKEITSSMVARAEKKIREAFLSQGISDIYLNSGYYQQQQDLIRAQQAQYSALGSSYYAQMYGGYLGGLTGYGVARCPFCGR